MQSSNSTDNLNRLVRAYAFLVAALVLECLVFQGIAWYQGGQPFLSVPSLINVLNRSVVYGVMSVGMTFVILTGGIDLSVGSVAALAGVLCAMVVQGHDAAPWPWIVLGWSAAALAGVVSGGVAGLVITRFAIPPFIATLALMSSLRGLGNILAGGRPVSPMPDAYTILGRHRIGDIVPMGVIVMAGVFVIGAILLEQTRFGRHVRAIGGSEESARLSGIPVNHVKFAVYCMAGLLGAVGGLIVSSKLGAGDPKTGLGYELGVIAAVVVGGTSLSGGRGTIGGTFLGLLIIAVLESGLNWIGVATFGQQVVLGLVILAAVLLDRFQRT